ncbi:hypothetical protein ACIPF8_21875 [Collimonas sp. NPDC087041]|uniref:hypothetical protein n=1 Tax=Collimonas sp. NPDC087041 TaxID=3363960 RepID=UPI0037F8771A
MNLILDKLKCTCLRAKHWALPQNLASDEAREVNQYKQKQVQAMPQKGHETPFYSAHENSAVQIVMQSIHAKNDSQAKLRKAQRASQYK